MSKFALSALSVCFGLVLSASPVFSSDARFTEFAAGIPEADGLAFDTEGNLYVACETLFGSVIKIMPDGKKSVLVRGIPSADGILWDRGMLYVTSEVANGAVVSIDSASRKQTYFKLKNPEGLALGRDGALYVAEDLAGGRIVRIKDGAGTFVCEGLSKPENLAFDDTGRIFITETGTGRILDCDPASGKLEVFLEKGLAEPDGIIFEPLYEGFFVTEDRPRDARLLYISRAGEMTVLFAGLREPQGLVFDAAGNLYLAEQGKHRVLKFSSSEIARCVTKKPI